MNYSISVLQNHRRDLLATANALELKMAQMLDPHAEAAVDQIRTYRLRAEELALSIAVLEQSGVRALELKP